ncbi:MAG: hypothetical protein MI920_11650 [Kiloniellales bacterium]|nr:hypothetical protein [Kiloniellales bacterium]
MSLGPTGLFARWAYRLDFLKREIEARARQLRMVTDSLARLPEADPAMKPTVLIDGEAEAAFLARAMRFGLLPKLDLRRLQTADDIEAFSRDVGTRDRPLYVAGSLFARHYTLFIETFGRERLTVL